MVVGDDYENLTGGWKEVPNNTMHTRHVRNAILTSNYDITKLKIKVVVV